MCNSEYIEIKAEIFKVIRANVDRSPKQIMKAIKEHVPEADEYLIGKCLNDLVFGE